MAIIPPPSYAMAALGGSVVIETVDGKVIYDVRGEEKAHLHRADLMAKFEEAAGEEFSNDRMLLG